MAELYTVTYLLEAAAGAEGDVVVKTIGAARRFNLKNVTIYFEAGCGFELQLSIFRGIFQVAPREGFYASDGRTVRDAVDDMFESGERIILHYKNTGSSTRKALVQLQGLME